MTKFILQQFLMLWIIFYCILSLSSSDDNKSFGIGRARNLQARVPTKMQNILINIVINDTITQLSKETGRETPPISVAFQPTLMT